MFTFNFAVEGEQSSFADFDSFHKGDLKCQPCEQIPFPEDRIFPDIDQGYSVFSQGNVNIRYLKTDVLQDFIRIEGQHTDLVPGVYEGGAKVWECTRDLLDYLESNYTDEQLKQKSVLDLGCGCGILGIYALKNCSFVHFQDYNRDVIKNATIPNISLNFTGESLKDLLKTTRLYSGDWLSFNDFTANEKKFDLILSSETIYNPSNYEKLINIFKTKLEKHGKVLLAAKKYYFGVGGSVKQFQELVENDGSFNTHIVWRSNKNVPREILEICLKK